MGGPTVSSGAPEATALPVAGRHLRRQERATPGASIESASMRVRGAAPDKLRGTASASAVAKAIGDAAFELGWDCDEVPMADGGEGTLDALGGANRSTTVTGPLGAPVEAAWRLDGRTAVIEMAAPPGWSWSAAPSQRPDRRVDRGHRRAHRRGARRRRAPGHRRVGRVRHDRRRAGRAPCPAPARPAEGRRAGRGVRQSRRRSSTRPRSSRPRRARHRRRWSCCVVASSGSRRCTSMSTVSTCSRSRGPAPPAGSAGGLAAAGGELVSGFDLVAEEVRLDERIEGADLVITGEGFLDEQSFEGKVVGGVAALATRLDVPGRRDRGAGVRHRRGSHRGGEPGGAVRRGTGPPRHARVHRAGRRRRPPPPRAHDRVRALPRPLDGAPPVPSASMVERIRRAGTVCWAVCGVAAVIALLGLIAYVFRVIWPPLILAGAIVFLLNPVVTRLQVRHIPRALGTGLSYLAVVGHHGARRPARGAPGHPPVRRPRGGVARAARGPRGGRQRPVGALGGGRVADPDPHLAGARGPVLGRGRRRHQQRRRGERGGGARPLRGADLHRSGAGAEGLPRGDHLRDRADHRVLPAGRPAPHPSGVPVAGARASPRRLHGAQPTAGPAIGGYFRGQLAVAFVVASWRRSACC